jgi:hypothetical protein
MYRNIMLSMYSAPVFFAEEIPSKGNKSIGSIAVSATGTTSVIHHQAIHKATPIMKTTFWSRAESFQMSNTLIKAISGPNRICMR